MLAHVGTDQRFAFGRSMQLANNCLRFDLVLRSCVTKWLRSLPAADLFPPRLSLLNRFLQSLWSLLLSECVKLLQRMFHIARESKCRRYVLADVCRVDIDVNHLGLRRKRREFASDTIVKSDSQR